MKKTLLLLTVAALFSLFANAQYSGGVGQLNTYLKETSSVDVVVGGLTTTGTVAAANFVGTMTLTNTDSTAWSVGYWTNSITGVGTNGVYVRKVYTPAGTTNTYYSLYQ